MNSAKVVVREEQRLHRFQVVPLLAESICEARKPADRSAHTQVAALNYAGADSARIGISIFQLRYCTTSGGEYFCSPSHFYPTTHLNVA